MPGRTSKHTLNLVVKSSWRVMKIFKREGLKLVI